MSEAFKCDSCGEYCSGNSAIVTLYPANIYLEKNCKYDLCPSCYKEVKKTLIKKKD